MKTCPYCAEEIHDMAIKCKHCGSMLDGSSMPPQQPISNNRLRNVVAVIILLLVILSFGFFHVVQLDNAPFLTVVPKEHFTYLLSVVSIDQIIERYNERSLGSALRGDLLLDHLVDELDRRGYISTRKRTWKDIEDKVRKGLPSE